MKLDKQKILAEIEKIRKGKSDRSKLKELLGGEELKEVFDEDTISSLEEVLIETDKIHNSLSEQENFDTLEGLLNKKILGNLGEFYNIKPEFILTLPKEEQAKLAHTFAVSVTNSSTYSSEYIFSLFTSIGIIKFFSSSIESIIFL